MTAKAMKHSPLRAFALMLPALALPLAGCGKSSREEELTKELEQVKQELEQAKAAQKAAEQTAEEAKDAYARGPTVYEDTSPQDDNEDAGNMDNSDNTDDAGDRKS